MLVLLPCLYFIYFWNKIYCFHILKKACSGTRVAASHYLFLFILKKYLEELSANDIGIQGTSSFSFTFNGM